jgi:hypothetical protein
MSEFWSGANFRSWRNADHDGKITVKELTALGTPESGDDHGGRSKSGRTTSGRPGEVGLLCRRSEHWSQ